MICLIGKQLELAPFKDLSSDFGINRTEGVIKQVYVCFAVYSPGNVGINMMRQEEYLKGMDYRRRVNYYTIYHLTNLRRV